MVDSISLKIKRMMVDQDLNQQDVADKLGVTQTTVSRIINGKTDISYSMMNRMMKAFDLPIEFFDEEQPGNIAAEPVVEYGNRGKNPFAEVLEWMEKMERRMMELEGSKMN